MDSDPDIEFVPPAAARHRPPQWPRKPVASSSKLATIDLTCLSDSDEDIIINQQPSSSTPRTALNAASSLEAGLPLGYATSRAALLGKQSADASPAHSEQRRTTQNAKRGQWGGTLQAPASKTVRPRPRPVGGGPSRQADAEYDYAPVPRARNIGRCKRPAPSSAPAISNGSPHEVIELSDSDDAVPVPRKRQRTHESPPIHPFHTQAPRVRTPLFLPSVASSDKSEDEIVVDPPLDILGDLDHLDVNDPNLWDNTPSTNRRRRQIPVDHSADTARELSAALETLRVRTNTHDPPPSRALCRERGARTALPLLYQSTARPPPNDPLTDQVREAEWRASRRYAARMRGRNKDAEGRRQLLQDFLDHTREERGLPVSEGETLNSPALLRYVRNEQVKHKSASSDGPTIANPRLPPRAMRRQSARHRMRTLPGAPREESSDEDMYV